MDQRRTPSKTAHASEKSSPALTLSVSLIALACSARAMTKKHSEKTLRCNWIGYAIREGDVHVMIDD